MQNNFLKDVKFAGCCELCSKSSNRLERHHISYKPEITCHLCHECHFKIHFQPWALSDSNIRALLIRRYKPEVIEQYKGNIRALLSLSHSHSYENEQPKKDFEVSEIAPSRTAFLKTETNRQ